MTLTRTIAALALAAGAAGAAQAQPAKVDGHAAYLTSCASCHADDLSGGTGPALKGEVFLSHWGAPHTPKELLSKIRTTMPVGAAGSLPIDQYAAITLYIMGQNGMTPAPAAAPAPGAH